MTTVNTTVSPGECHEAPSRFERINRELATMFPRRGPAALVADGSACRADDLILCGILGGKDVGKSTLINAIAGNDVSSDSEEVGRGTSAPVAYVHEEDRAALIRRFGRESLAGIKPTLVGHRVDAVRGLVLVDMPDFDSTFTDHLEVVSRTTGVMDRVVWICDPKKIADRLWADLLPRVVKDTENVFCVLNKFDLLLGDQPSDNGMAQTFDRAHEYFADCLASLRIAGGHDRRFVCSAAFCDPEQFTRAVTEAWGASPSSRDERTGTTIRKLGRAGQADLDRLRNVINTPVSIERAREIKAANLKAEAKTNAETLRAHFDISGQLQAMHSAIGGIENEAESRFDEEWVATLADRLAHAAPPDTDLADELMKERTEHWPILGAIYWALHGLFRRVSGRLASTPQQRTGPGDPFRIRGVSLEDRIGALQAAARSRFAAVLEEMSLTRDWPAPDRLAASLRSGYEELRERTDRRILDACRAEYNPPGFLAKSLVWIVLIWFPLLQPLVEGSLETFAAQGLTHTLHGLMIVVRALGAASLLRGLIVVLIIYVAGLGIMYARAVRAVRLARRDARGPDAESGPRDESQTPVNPYAEAIGCLLNDEILHPLTEPLLAAHRKLESLNHVVSEIARSP